MRRSGARGSRSNTLGGGVLRGLLAGLHREAKLLGSADARCPQVARMRDACRTVGARRPSDSADQSSIASAPDWMRSSEGWPLCLGCATMSPAQHDIGGDEPRDDAKSESTHKARGSRLNVKDVGWTRLGPHCPEKAARQLRAASTSVVDARPCELACGG